MMAVCKEVTCNASQDNCRHVQHVDCLQPSISWHRQLVMKVLAPCMK